MLAVAAPVVVAPHAPAHAAAADDEAAAKKRARRHFERGEKLFALGRFDEALRAYEKAFEEYPAPEFLFNIGQCHRNLGNYDEAIFSFRKYLKLRPDAANREAVEEYIAELEEERRNARQKDPIVEPPPPPPKRRDKPVYKKWWFWTGVAVVAGGVTAVVITQSGSGLPDTDLGNIDFSK
jgi:tetratricopeptide (TPR) repeat protein